MVQIRLCRANHNSEEKLKNLIYDVWNMPGAVYLKAVNCMSRSAKAIISSFLFVQHRYERYIYTKYHFFELLFYQEDEPNVVNIVQVVESFLTDNFQFIVRTDKLENGCYKATFVINSVSYTNKGMFSDRNDTYIRLSNDLNKITNTEVIIAEGTLFDINQGYARNYIEPRI